MRTGRKCYNSVGQQNMKTNNMVIPHLFQQQLLSINQLRVTVVFLFSPQLVLHNMRNDKQQLHVLLTRRTTHCYLSSISHKAMASKLLLRLRLLLSLLTMLLLLLLLL